MDIFTRKEKINKHCFLITKNVLERDKDVILDALGEERNDASPPSDDLPVTPGTVENLEVFFDETYFGIKQTILI